MAVTAERKSNGSKEDKITLWHTASDIVALESFIDEGAQAIGVGRGGQTDGCRIGPAVDNEDLQLLHVLGRQTREGLSSPTSHQGE